MVLNWELIDMQQICNWSIEGVLSEFLFLPLFFLFLFGFQSLISLFHLRSLRQSRPIVLSETATGLPTWH